MTPAEMIVYQLEYNMTYITRHTDGLTTADTLLQLDFPVNCMNWNLGHMAVYRDAMLQMTGADPLMTPEERKRYEFGSAPITSADAPHLPLERLLDIIHTAQRGIAERLPQMSADDLAALFNPERPDLLSKLHRFGRFTAHDAYHAGQLEPLRELVNTRRG